jgi:predicted small lipoprotein YifL
MKLPAARVLALPLFVAGLLLAACGQKGALTLPESGGATPIVIREAQPPVAMTTPIVTEAAAPAEAPANPPPQR